MIHFKSITKEQTISFKTDYKLTDNVYFFDDLSVSNTKIKLEIINDKHIAFHRFGDTNMYIDYKIAQTTNSIYQDKMGLKIDLKIKTNRIILKNQQIFIDYDNIFDDFTIINHKIWIIIK